jgi:hypothetical protein
MAEQELELSVSDMYILGTYLLPLIFIEDKENLQPNLVYIYGSEIYRQR